MANATENNNHVAEALARLPEQYKNSENIRGIIESLVTGIQEDEAMFIDLRDNRTLDNAFGDSLDLIGSIVGVARIAGEDDETYRGRIRLGIFKNRSQGTPEILIEVVQNFTNSTQIVFYEGGIASFAFNIDDQTLTQDEIDDLYSGLREAKSAGVTIEHVTSFATDDAFAFDGAGYSALGFGDSTDLGVGGEFATVLIES